MRDLRTGDIVGGFVVKDRIGHGGMGDVYLVHDEKLAVDRALKLISLTGPGFTGTKAEAGEYRVRFLREARTLAKLRHPNIIAIHATGEHDGDPFLVMSHFPSTDARRWLNDQQPDLKRVRHVSLQVARALAHAHESGVLHRDIKLGNILVGPNDEAMLIDFGLAKSAVDSELTRVGRTMGTFSYLAPEYVRASTIGKPTHTTATDLWAMGCLIYAMTCREPAFRDKDEQRLLRLIARASFVPVKQRAPDAPAAWATLIHQLMEPDPAQRLPSASELVARIESIDLSAPEPKRDLESQAAPPPIPQEVQHDAPAVIPVPVELPPPDDGTVALAVDAPSESIFDHTEDETGPTSVASVILRQPSFQLPAERAATARASARRKLVLPIAVALVVLGVGAGLIAAIGKLGTKNAARSTYVDPEELQHRQRSANELEQLSQERTRRSSLDVAPVPITPFFAERSSPPSERAATAAPREQSAPMKRASTRRVPSASAPVAASTPSNPWLERYGTRASYNTSSGAGATIATTTAASTASAAGTRISVRVTSAIASAPLGPVIAIVQTATKLGALDIPRGAELHGRVTGAEGPRVLVDFTFVLVNGKSVALKGIALGQDGRAGVPGAKSVGGVSDIGAGAAGGGAQALLDGAVALVDNEIAGGALRGATASIVNKTTRLNNEEEFVVANAGAKFFVYIESVL